MKQRGFSVIELLVVVAVLGGLSAVILTAVDASKAKGDDAQVKQTLSDIQVNVEKYDIAPGVVDYTQAFSAIQVPTMITNLATKLHLTAGTYNYGVAKSEYAIVFPLKASVGSSYLCVDSTHAVKQVDGLLNSIGPKNCDNIVAAGDARADRNGSQAPVVSITSPSNNSSAFGNINIVANATDDVAVAGVTFKYGASVATATTTIGAEDTTGVSNLYSISWNTSALTNGTYVIIAVARDAVGNSTISSGVTVTIGNAAGGGQGGSRKALIFSSGFEGTSGTFLNGFDPDVHQYCCSYSITQSTTVKREGLASMRAEVRKNDAKVSGAWRAEVQPLGIEDTGDRWYGWSMYFESPQTGGIFSGKYGGQYVNWNSIDDVGASPLSFSWSDNVWDLSTSPTIDDTEDHYGPNGLSPQTQITANVWHDIVVHANWSTGQLAVWIDGNLFYIAAAGSGIVDETPGQYLKFGMAKWGNGSGGKPTDNWVIYYDNLRIGDGATGVNYYDVAPGNY